MKKSLLLSVFVFCLSLQLVNSMEPTLTNTEHASKYRNGTDGFSKNQRRAVELYKLDSDGGNAEAQNALGEMYRDGHGIKDPQHTTSYNLFSKAYKQNYLPATSNLAGMYENGFGVTINPKKAVELYTEASNKGCPEAQKNLAGIYLNGLYGTPKNTFKALELYTKSATQGNSRAQNNLGKMYEEGIGTPVDKDMAFKLYKKSADQKFPAAIISVKRMMASEAGISGDKRTESYIQNIDWGSTLSSKNEKQSPSIVTTSQYSSKSLKRKNEQSDPIAEIKKQKTDIYDFEQINDTNIDSFIELAPVSDNTKKISSFISPQNPKKINSGFCQPMHHILRERYGTSPLIVEGTLKIGDVNKKTASIASPSLPALKTPKGNVVHSLPLIQNKVQKTSYEDKDLCEPSHIQGRDEHLMLLRDMLESAEQNILITSHSITRIEPDIYRLLSDAIYRGVKIDIYYNKSINEKVAEKFQDYNIRCEQTNIHAKYLIIDKKNFILGSYNWLDFNNGDTDRSFKISGNEKYVNQLRGKAYSDIIKNRYSPSNEKYAFKELDINRSSNLMLITTLFDHEEYLLSACKEARRKVVIYSPFVTLVNAKKRLNDISKCLNENVKLFLVIGDLYKALSNIVKNMPLLNKRTEITFDDQFHRKTLIIDDNIISEGSFNWLSSAVSTESDYHNQDSSLVIRGPFARYIINNDDDLFDNIS